MSETSSALAAEKKTVQYTPRQIEAISSRAPQILVSAAAGSGKTSVLSKRIEALIRGADLEHFEQDDGTQVNVENMAHVENMLVMTFTRAAAGEMRQRIIHRLHEAAERQPRTDSTDLSNDPATMLYQEAENAAGADILTIHGFCSRVIGENYERAGVAPRVSVLGDTQRDHIIAQVLRQLFDDLYEEEDQGILTLLRKYTTNGDDARIATLVTDTYEKMMGSPNWNEWLDLSITQDYPEQVKREVVKQWATQWKNRIDLVLGRVKAGQSAAKKSTDEVRRNELVQAVEDLEAMKASIPEEEALDNASDEDIARTLEDWAEIWGPSKLRLLTALRSAIHAMEAVINPSPTLQKDLNRTLDLVNTLSDYATPYEKMESAKDDIRILADLVRKFEQRYTAKKRSLNKVDYNDLEHLTLKVLYSLKEDGETLKKRYTHIFVDEYQDTNPVQESILQALCQIEPEASTFMVGDLKQSIYGFRAADTANFKSKEDTAIHMNNNFRSSKAVIETVNNLMRCLMDEELGDVTYSKDEELVFSAADKGVGNAQVLIAQQGKINLEGSKEAVDAEAVMIADKIKQLHRDGRSYGDIAILARSRSTIAYTDLGRVLEVYGIPYWIDQDSFQTFTELDLFLNLLELVVNERRDVPLLSVLRSYMYNMNERHFAAITEWCQRTPVTDPDETQEEKAKEDDPGARHKDRIPFFRQAQRFYLAHKKENTDREGGQEAVLVFERDENDEKTREEIEYEAFQKLDKLFRDLTKLRIRGTDMALDRFVDEVAAKYDFAGYLLTRPSGVNRRRAFESLLESIREQQTISGNSLYRVLNAVREKRGKGRKDTKTAAALDDAVRILTMHKSKGLEFPVVFLANLNRKFSTQNQMGPLLLDKDYGVQLDYVNDKAHVKSKTVQSEYVREQIKKKDRSEELRVLYVALTRAQEELYLCGSADKAKDLKNWQQGADYVQSASNMLGWVMSAYYMLAGDNEAPAYLYDETAPWFNTQPTEDAVSSAETSAYVDPTATAIQTLRANMSEEPDKTYQLPDRQRMPAVLSVSKMVTAAASSDKKSTENALYTTKSLRPASSATDEMAGAERGTALHEALQYAVRENRARMHPLPGEEPEPLLDGKQTVMKMLEAHLFTEEVATALKQQIPADDDSEQGGLEPTSGPEVEAFASAIDAFLQSELYERVKNADKVLIEQRFTILMSPSEKGYEESAQMTRLQGRIDLAFLEKGQWVLVDYKSDRTSTQKALKERYAAQMAWYKKALEQTTGMPVRECYLFSLEFAKPIRLTKKDLAEKDRVEDIQKEVTEA